MTKLIGITLAVILGLVALRFLYKSASAFKFQIDSEKTLNRLRNSDPPPDHVLHGLIRVVFNDKHNEIIFINGKKLLKYNYSDISDWRWEWVEYDGVRKDNKIIFYIRDPNRPLLAIEGLNAQAAEQWHAEIENILRD